MHTRTITGCIEHAQYIERLHVHRKYIRKYLNLLSLYQLWHFVRKGPIWSKWSYCQGKVVWAISKHLRSIPSPTFENSLRNGHLNLKNLKSENFKMLRNRNFNIFSPEKAISSSYMWICGYDIIYNSSASNCQQLGAKKYVRNPFRQQLENEKGLEERAHLVVLEKKFHIIVYWP